MIFVCVCVYRDYIQEREREGKNLYTLSHIAQSGKKWEKEEKNKNKRKLVLGAMHQKTRWNTEKGESQPKGLNQSSYLHTRDCCGGYSCTHQHRTPTSYNVVSPHALRCLLSKFYQEMYNSFWKSALRERVYSTVVSSQNCPTTCVHASHMGTLNIFLMSCCSWPLTKFWNSFDV